MAVYVDKEKLMAFPIRRERCDREHADHHFINGIETVMEYAESLPSEDVAPVVHGRWERVIPTKSAAKWSTKVSCSVCHRQGYDRYKFCSNCGAKMDLEG